jgi:hypothetical protein
MPENCQKSGLQAPSTSFYVAATGAVSCTDLREYPYACELFDISVQIRRS